MRSGSPKTQTIELGRAISIRKYNEDKMITEDIAD